MSSSPIRLVSHPDQARQSHHSYQQALDADASDARQVLLDAIPYAQNWIAIVGGDQVLFAPSKFCGYHAMRADAYQQNRDHLDGRLTERVLTPWVQAIEPGDPDHDRFRDALFAFCACFGKKPNGRCRISVLVDAGKAVGTELEDRHAVVADLLVATFHTLPRQHQRRVAQQLAIR